jgi:hypothetical protein
MDDRKKTLAALTIVIGIVLLVLIVIGTLVSGKSVTSPVPDEGAIRIIFATPTLIPTVTPTPTP